MDKKILSKNIKNVYFIGIGGISMSGLAKFLFAKGYVVSGSDKHKSAQTKELEKLGIKVYYSNDAKKLVDTQLVVFSSAISEDNKELLWARENNIVSVTRSQLLGEILSEYKTSIAISGCHGKTTCTAMTSEIMIRAGRMPTVFLGGEYGDYGNFLNGEKELAIAEACEYKKSFLDIKPKIAVVLNIDNDHLDSYLGMKDLVGSFKSFIGERLAIVNADDPNANAISNCTTVSFGINNVATYYATDVKETEKGISFTACAYAKPYGRINLSVSGLHNVYNALSAFATADLLGVYFKAIKQGLERFKGVKRRNEYLGEKDGMKFYADYAHHPTEIKATLKAFSSGGQDFITVFQPHTYSRTKLLYQDFLDCFSAQNDVIIYKTYPAREKFDKKGSALNLKLGLDKKLQSCSYAHTPKQLEQAIEQIKGDKKRIIFLGAGDIYQIALRLLR